MREKMPQIVKTKLKLAVHYVRLDRKDGCAAFFFTVCHAVAIRYVQFSRTENKNNSTLNHVLVDIMVTNNAKQVTVSTRLHQRSKELHEFLEEMEQDFLTKTTKSSSDSYHFCLGDWLNLFARCSKNPIVLVH